MKSILSLLFILLLFSVGQVFGLNMSNSNYTIQMGNLDMTGGSVSNPSYKLGFTSGETGAGLYSKDGVNYKVMAGFQYINSIIPFSFTISSLTLDFGNITFGQAYTRTNELTVSNGSANGYSVLAYENHPLRINAKGVDIPDTTCDDGNCTSSQASTWTSVLTYGFGYRCDNVSGTDCPTDFTANTYRPFANNEKGDTGVAVMSGTEVGSNKKAQITYKLNIANGQAAGIYQNSIIYIAVPHF